MNLQEAIEYLKHANFTTEAKVPMLALAEAVEKQGKRIEAIEKRLAKKGKKK